MAKPVVFGANYSSYVRTVRIALAEKGVDHDLVEVCVLDDSTRGPEHLARHPFGKVPVLEHDGFRVYETPAILRYVDEALDGPPLQPADVRARVRMVQISSIVDNYLYQPGILQLAIQRVVVPMTGGTPDQAVIEEAKPKTAKALATIDALARGRFLAGDAISLADCALVPIMGFLSMTPDLPYLPAPCPALSAWWPAIQDRQSVRDTAPRMG